jgi:hypothetical protein
MPFILGANSLAGGGYEIDNSLRFNRGSSDYLNRTPASTTNQTTWTYSTWIKISFDKSNYPRIFSAGTTTANHFEITLMNETDGSELRILGDTSSSRTLNWTTAMKFRDPSAWYHLVVALDTTQATQSNRLKVYVNGSLFSTAGASSVLPSQNNTYVVNSTTQHNIGRSNPYSEYYTGYMAETYLIDGQQLAPSDFGEFDEDSGIWKPIAYEGTYGTNGFYLEFKDSSALGDDTSGNTNDFTVNNLTSIDQTTDTPTNNFATMNPLTKSSLANLEEGNLKVIANSPADNGNTQITFAPQVGKWYFECKLTIDNASYPRIGIAPIESVGRLLNANDGQAGVITGSAAQYANGDKYISGSQTASYGASYSTGDIMGIALDFDNGAFYTSKNGTWQGSSDPESGASKTNALFTWTAGAEEYIASLTTFNTSSAIEVNFGNPAFTISSGNSDANGYGNFEYAVPSGYYALNTKNLAEYG